MKDKESKMIVKVIIMLISFKLLSMTVGILYRLYQFTIMEELGIWGTIIALFLEIVPILIVVLIVFSKFLKKHKQKTILWCIFAIVEYRLAIIVFLLFFLDGKFTAEESQKSLADPIPDDDKKIGDDNV